MDRFRDVSAVVLCGGQSERMGFPKAMLRVDGAPLAVQMVRRLAGVFESVFVSSNHPQYLRHLLDVPVLEDGRPDAGPMAGILAGLAHGGAERVFFLACDMPGVHSDLIRALVDRARQTDAQAVCGRSGGVPQPLCGVYAASLAPRIERMLAAEGSRSVTSLLKAIPAEYIDATGLRDVDTPEDLPLLRQDFSEVEPLPVRLVPAARLGGLPIEKDAVVVEWPVAVYANRVKLATVLCMPTAVRELAVGFAAYLGLVQSRDDVRGARVDYDARRANLELDVEDERIRNAVQLLVTSTCGANVYGPPLPEPPSLGGGAGFRVGRSHLLMCIQSLRAMAPAFARTGCTHQAAFSDGQRIRVFYEDIGRHSAVDKVVGDSLIAGADLSRGVLVTTGRLNAEMVVKALRQRVPVLASRSAVTSHATQLARQHGVTLVGFARNGRVNVYTHPERVTDE